ncbi:unnamed protein product [Cylicocyclus nassatus]|uniref:Uncharacterized protein n=1 Tax=Cylicocyclus nassatus TaxID=53992 RepID=A0AA36H4H0_CYLNA|nr:unnamed protein product [Cylicocyclus nassatus]
MLRFMQSAGATVTFRCNDRPFTNAKVRLDEAEFFVDGWMGGPVKPDRFGVAKVHGSAAEITQIDPYLRITHWCNRSGMSPIQFCIDIPPQFINYGREVKRYWHIRLELSKKHPKQRNC